jgi:hypothetical protein
LKYEEFLDQYILDGFLKTGYNLSELTNIADGQAGVACVQACTNKAGVFYGGSDRRKFGDSVAY